MSEQSSQAYSFETLRQRLRFRGQLVTRTSLRIGAGRDASISGTDLPVMRDVYDRPFIPGSSFKGVLRSSLEAVLRGLVDGELNQRRLACVPLVDEQRCISTETKRGWEQERGAVPPLAERILQASCLICQTFGSAWLASHIAVRDLTVDPSIWFGQFEVRQGVSLDRDTETAREGLLYDFETVPPGTQFYLEIEADNLVDWQKGLLWLGLQPFIRGEQAMGGARSRGLGLVEVLEGDWAEWIGDPGRPESVIAFLSRGLQRIDRAEIETWQASLRARLEEVAGA